MCRRGNNYNMHALHLHTLGSCLASGGRLEIDGETLTVQERVRYNIKYTSDFPSLLSLQWSHLGADIIRLSHLCVSTCISV